jgi:hypothetical protein
MNEARTIREGAPLRWNVRLGLTQVAVSRLAIRLARLVRGEARFLSAPDDHTVSGSQEEIFHHYGLDGSGLAVAARHLLVKR